VKDLDNKWIESEFTPFYTNLTLAISAPYAVHEEVLASLEELERLSVQEAEKHAKELSLQLNSTAAPQSSP
jgi:hypothetical protein